MKFLIQLTIFMLLYVSVIKTTVYSDVRYNILRILRMLNETDNEEKPFKTHNSNKNERKRFDVLRDINDATFARNKIKKIKKNRISDSYSIRPMTTHAMVEKRHYIMDPVLNFLGRRAGQYKMDSNQKHSRDYSSSSIETKDWKTEWKEHWIKNKFVAMNSTPAIGDVVNMVAARPRGARCGDPNQHDMPWGTCMLTMECEPEFRIYRGDYFCGRTQYVCCYIRLHSYDMYQGFDVSFADTSQSSDVDNRQKGSQEVSKKKRRHEKRKLKKERQRRKTKMKRYINKVIKEITKVLSRTYRNATTVRKRISKHLNIFIKELKERYKKNRQPLKKIHELDLIMLDNSIQKKMNEIKEFNNKFITNSTFREAVLDGNIKKMDGWDTQYIRNLVQDYPEVTNDETRRFKNLHDLNNYSDHEIIK